MASNIETCQKVDHVLINHSSFIVVVSLHSNSIIFAEITAISIKQIDVSLINWWSQPIIFIDVMSFIPDQLNRSNLRYDIIINCHFGYICCPDYYLKS